MKMRTTISVFLVFLLSLFLVSNESGVAHLLAKSESIYAKVKVFTSILETIQRVYMYEKSVDDLLEDAIKGVISNLDPHTVYLHPDDFRNWSENFEGYTGIGISFEVIRQNVRIMSVLESSPASKFDIRPGDRIVRINGHDVRGPKKDEISAYFEGAERAPVSLQIIRDGWSYPKKYQIFRQRIVLDSVPHATMVKAGVGYIKIDKFTSSTTRELEVALNKLEKAGMTSLVLDLRGNGGGYLNAAVDVTDKFIPSGNVILRTKGRLSSSYHEYHATAKATHEQYPLIVLIDHGSASASEIVAGAIQDLDRGLIIGKTSFGKGLVQSQYRFHDGSALLITTAKYYTPSGRQIQREFFDRTKDEYYREAYDDALRNENILAEKTIFRTASGRKVYGGGGIVPDVWIENDGNALSENLRALYFSDERLLYTFIDDILKVYPHIKDDKEKFLAEFEISDSLLGMFLKFVRTSDSEFSDLDYSGDESDIKFLLKRGMAYMLWGAQARFTVNMSRDFQLKEAIKHLSQADALLTANLSN